MTLDEAIKEEWRVLEDYPNYSISNLGLVKNNQTETLRKLYANKRGKGYLCCSIPNKNGKYKTVTVHRLVAKAFIPNPENKPQVNHIDGDVKNNCVVNLEWCTQKENNYHAWNVINSENRRNIMAKYAHNRIWSDESKEKISKKNKGRKHTEEARKNMSNAHKGKPNVHKMVPVRCIETNQIYPSVSEAALAVGCRHTNISNVLSNRSYTAKGYHWERM